MAEYITSLTMKDGSKKQWDYNALANKPEIQAPLSDTDGGYGQRVKALEDALDDIIDGEELVFNVPD